MPQLPLVEQYLTQLDLDPSTAYRVMGANDWFSANRVYVRDASELPRIQSLFLHTPHTIWVDANNSSVKEALLHSKLYQYDSAHPVMVVELSKLKQAPTFSGYLVKEINGTGSDMDIWIETLSRAYPADYEGFQKLIDHYRTLPAWQGMRFFLVYAQGLPAATSMTVQKGDTIGLDWVAVLPEFRAKGLGRLASSFALQNVEREAQYAVLMASKMGKTMYEDLGFKTVGLVDMYKSVVDA